jgi:hypothetical protein
MPMRETIGVSWAHESDTCGSGGFCQFQHAVKVVLFCSKVAFWHKADQRTWSASAIKSGRSLSGLNVKI